MFYVTAISEPSLPAGTKVHDVTYAPDGSGWCALVDGVVPGMSVVSEEAFLVQREANLKACADAEEPDKAAEVLERIVGERAHPITAPVSPAEIAPIGAPTTFMIVTTDPEERRREQLAEADRLVQSAAQHVNAVSVEDLQQMIDRAVAARTSAPNDDAPSSDHTTIVLDKEPTE